VNIKLELDPATIGKTLAAAFAQATGATGKWSCNFKVDGHAFIGATLTLDEHPTPPAPAPDNAAGRPCVHEWYPKPYERGLYCNKCQADQTKGAK